MMDAGPEVNAVWGAVGTILIAIATGIGGLFYGRHRRDAEGTGYKAESVGNQAVVVIIDQLRGEVQRLSTRVTELEHERREDRKHIYALEWALRNAGLDPLAVLKHRPDEE